METFKRADVNVRGGTLDCIFLLEYTTKKDDLIDWGSRKNII